MALNKESLATSRDEMMKDNVGMDKAYYNLEDGKNEIRVLPRSMKFFTKEGDDDFAFKFYVHYNLFDKSGFKMLVCRKTLGEACPLCDFIKKSNLPNLSKARYVYNVLDLSDNQVKILTTGPMVYGQILNFLLNPDWGDICGVKDGRDVTITRVPAAKSPNGRVSYNTIPSPQQKDITEILPEHWEETVDSLEQQGIPFIFSEEKMAELIDIYKNGGDPTVVASGASKVEPPHEVAVSVDEEVIPETKEAEKPKDNSVAAPVVEEKPVAATKEKSTGAIKDCFGEGFSFKKEDCRNCATRKGCKKIYFENVE